MLFSVLIATLERRRHLFARVYDQLVRQSKAGGLDELMEVLYLRDDGERSIGWKRNQLMEQARGEFVAFVDDDDRVSDDYARLICDAIRRHPDIDCIGIRGVITFRGEHPHEFINSIRHADYRCSDGVYLGPPIHFNPIRRSIASRYRFEDVSYSEDIDWSMRIARDGLLRTECFIEPVLYYYDSRGSWAYQWLMDRTEKWRHALGLRLYNRLRLERGARAVLARARGVS
ncbi:MAG: glycosyltransferase [Bryobacteraceae bacterium]|jgi:glycosyltransferase involved in cell wall biosynthesis